MKGGKINDAGYGRLACGLLVLMASAYRFNPPGRPTWKVLDDGRVSAFARTLLEVNPDSDMGKGFRAVQLAKSAAASTAVDVSASVNDGGDFDPRTRPQGASSRDVESDVGSGVAEERSPPILSELWPNVILEGVPGTGKTHAYRERFLKAYRESVDCGAITFHAATAYEDFMEGLRPGMRQESNRERPVVSDSRIRGDSGGDWFFDPPRESLKSGSTGGMWSVHDGFFVTACIKAARAPTTPHFVLLDELNRANVPAVMGDLLTLLEPSKRAVWTDAGWEVVHCVHLAVVFPS